MIEKTIIRLKKMIDKMYQEIKPFIKANDFDSAQKKLNQLILNQLCQALVLHISF